MTALAPALAPMNWPAEPRAWLAAPPKACFSKKEEAELLAAWPPFLAAFPASTALLICCDWANILLLFTSCYW